MGLYTIIVCNACRKAFDGHFGTLMRPDEVRDYVAFRGWTRELMGDRDICATCTNKGRCPNGPTEERPKTPRCNHLWVDHGFNGCDRPGCVCDWTG